ncbi:hypothetical protein SuNHUV7_14650 (plasmid) [Pseudoseohaeicola sp. NH-UV-7]|jgi:hypothetical protein
MSRPSTHNVRRIFYPSPVALARDIFGWISFTSEQCRAAQRQINRTYNQ